MSLENKTYRHSLLSIVVNVCRWLLAAVFLFSGFIKANDVQGTVYKIQEYFGAWGLWRFSDGYIPYFIAWGLAIVEFWIGVNLFFGIRRRFTPFISFVMISIMTPITLWLAIANPVSDCGCFGDAIILTNWETFIKNLLLWIASYLVMRHSEFLIKLVTDKVDWLISLYGMVYISIFMTYTSMNLPVIDFRPYSIGTDIKAGMEIPEGEKAPVFETVFIYQKGGEQRTFTVDALPDDSWEFVDRQTTLKEKGYIPPIHDFSLHLYPDGTEITQDVLNDSNYTFLLISPRLQNADDSEMDKINHVYDYTLERGYSFYCVTGSSDAEIEDWTDNTGAEYPFARMDATALKTIIRSNPGLLLLKNGVIINKWDDASIPAEETLNKPLSQLTIGKVNLKTIERTILDLVLFFVVPLFILSLLDLLWRKVQQRRRHKTLVSSTNSEHKETGILQNNNQS